jgi:alkaline phosphatase D
VGRVKFIVTDLRSERDDSDMRDSPNKSMMGAKQKAWFKKELLAANGKHPLIFWVTTVPWLGRAGVNYYPLRAGVTGFIHQTNLWQFRADPAMAEDAGQRRFGGDDHWGRFDFERREIIHFIAANRIEGVAILHGDAHSVAADNGTSDEFANSLGLRIPVMAAAPLDQDASIKGGPYSQGIYKPRPGEGCFGFMQVRDDGNRISVYFSGRNNLNEEKISLRFALP